MTHVLPPECWMGPVRFYIHVEVFAESRRSRRTRTRNFAVTVAAGFARRVESTHRFHFHSPHLVTRYQECRTAVRILRTVYTSSAILLIQSRHIYSLLQYDAIRRSFAVLIYASRMQKAYIKIIRY